MSEFKRLWKKYETGLISFDEELLLNAICVALSINLHEEGDPPAISDERTFMVYDMIIKVAEEEDADFEGLQLAMAIYLSVPNEKYPEEKVKPFLERARQLDPDNFYIDYVSGTICHNQGELDDAEAHYKAAFKKGLKSIELLLNRARVQSEQGKYTDAIFFIMRADELCDEDETLNEYQQAFCRSIIFTEHAEILLREGDPNAFGYAVDKCLEAIELNPENAKAHLTLAMALNETSMKDKAKEHALEAVRLEPENFLAFYNLAAICFACGELEDAAHAYARAVDLNPEDADSCMHLLDVFDRLPVEKRDADRIEELTQHADSEVSACAHYVRAKSYIEKGRAEDKPKAVADLNKVIEAENTNYCVSAYVCLAMVLEDDKYFKKAEDFLLQACKRHPKQPELYAEMGFVKQQQKKWPEAEVAYKQAVKLDPGNPNYYLPIVYVQIKQGKLKKATAMCQFIGKHFKQQLKAEPHFQEALDKHLIEIQKQKPGK